VHVAVVRPSVYSRSACLPSPSPVPPLQPGCNYWCARVALAAIHHARARRRPISPDRERSRVRSVRSGRFSLKVLSNCRWGKEEGTGSDRALFCPLFPPAIKKNWIKGFAPLAKQIRRDPSWPPLRSGLGGINCAPPLPRLPYLRHPTAAAAEEGRKKISDQCEAKPARLSLVAWSVHRRISSVVAMAMAQQASPPCSTATTWRELTNTSW
jgi:hypothetical protein